MWVKGEYFDNFEAAEAAARGSLDRGSQPCLFDRLVWFRRTWEHCAPGVSPVIARAVSEKAQAWLFLARQEDGTLSALASWYTLAFRPVFVNADDDAMRQRLLTAIARRIRKTLGASKISLAPLPIEDGTVADLARAFRRAGWWTRHSEATVNWIADVTDASFADYWAARPGALRSTIARKAAKANAEFEIFDRFDEVAWQTYENIYAQSWKPDEGSPTFVRDMAVEEGAAGALRLGIAKLGGRPVAAQLWTIESGTAIIHKLAYAQDAGEFSPGSLLSATMFERAIDQDRVSTIDYGTGNDRYKADWMDRARQLERLDLFNPRSLAGIAGAARAWIAQLVRARRVD